MQRKTIAEGACSSDRMTGTVAEVGMACGMPGVAGAPAIGWGAGSGAQNRPTSRERHRMICASLLHRSESCV